MTLYRQLGDTRGLAGSLGNLGWSKYWQNDHAVARTLLQECIGLAREMSDTGVLAYGLRYLSEIFTMQSNFEQAFPLVEESVALCRELGDTHGLVLTLTALSRIVLYHNLLTTDSFAAILPVLISCSLGDLFVHAIAYYKEKQERLWRPIP